MREYAVVDNETTGLGDRDRIVEIAVVVLNSNFEIIDEWDTLLDPGCDVGPTHIHGITADMVSTAPTFDAIAGNLYNLLNGRVLVAHNLPFDEKMLNNEISRNRLRWSPGTGVDTLRHTGEKLGAACRSYGVPLVKAHQALSDARATAGLLHTGRLDFNPLMTKPVLFSPSNASTTHTIRRSAFPANKDQNTVLLHEIMDQVSFKNYDPSAFGYLDLLDRCLDDLVISDKERQHLTALAKSSKLDSREIRFLHLQYFDDLYRAANKDQQITIEEAKILVQVGEALGVEQQPRNFASGDQKS